MIPFALNSFLVPRYQQINSQIKLLRDGDHPIMNQYGEYAAKLGVRQRLAPTLGQPWTAPPHAREDRERASLGFSSS
jgi:hypothetical protein